MFIKPEIFVDKIKYSAPECVRECDGDCDSDCTGTSIMERYSNKLSVIPLDLNSGNLLSASPNLAHYSISSLQSLLFPHTSPPILVNNVALDILNTFNTPMPVLRAKNIFSDLGSQEFSSIVYSFIRLGLIQNHENHCPPDLITHTLTTWLHITNDCNLSCDYCYIHKSQSNMSEEIGKKSIEITIAAALVHNFSGVLLKYAGGEPTLNIDLVINLHQYANQLASARGLEINGILLTNGLLLSKDTIKKVINNRIRLAISLDGIAHFNDVQRHSINGHGSFNQIRQNLDRLVEYRVNPSINITVSDKNLEGVPELVLFLIQRNLRFSISFYRPTEPLSVSEALIDEKKLIAGMLKVYKVIEDNLPTYSVLGGLIDRANLNSVHKRTCSVGNSYMVVDNEGNIAKCHMKIDQKITNIFADNPLKLIQDDTDGIQNNSVDEKAGCQECEWRYWCAGGCPIATYNLTGLYDRKSPYCNVYKVLLPEALRIEAIRLRKYGIPVC